MFWYIKDGVKLMCVLRVCAGTGVDEARRDNRHNTRPPQLVACVRAPSTLASKSILNYTEQKRWDAEGNVEGEDDKKVLASKGEALWITLSWVWPLSRLACRLGGGTRQRGDER